MNLKKIAFTSLLQMGGGLENGNPYNSPTWFVCALFLCYIVFYAVCYYSKNDTQYCFLVVAGIAWGYYLHKAQLLIPFCYSENGIAFLNFFLGCALAELYPFISQKLHILLRPCSLLILVAIVCLFLGYGVEIICGDIYVGFSFVICPLILFLALSDGLCAKLLRTKPFVFLGTISTNVFFWHLVVYYAFCDLLQLFRAGPLRESQYLLYVLCLVLCAMIKRPVIPRR